MEQMLRLLHDCGLPKEDVDFINSDGITMNKVLLEVCFAFYLLHAQCIYEFSFNRLTVSDISHERNIVFRAAFITSSLFFFLPQRLFFSRSSNQ